MLFLVIVFKIVNLEITINDIFPTNITLMILCKLTKQHVELST